MGGGKRLMRDLAGTISEGFEGRVQREGAKILWKICTSEEFF
jgi:phage terminase large subunit-like protein